MRTELFCWCGADDLIFAATSEFLLVAPKVKKKQIRLLSIEDDEK
jgi:hypothetical protein